MISVPSYILDLCPPIFQSDFECIDISRFKVEPLYGFIEKLPLLTLRIEFKITLLLDEPLAGLGIGTYDEGFYVIVPAASNTNCQGE